MPANADTDGHTFSYPNSHIRFHAESDTHTEGRANAEAAPIDLQ